MRRDDSFSRARRNAAPLAAAILAGILVLGSVGSGRAAERMRFWNLTSVTISQLYLAPAGTARWGADQCKNDKDGTVDADERLNLVGIVPGRYDVKLVDKNGRACTVSGVEVAGGKPYAFSINDKDLTNCTAK